MDPIYCLDDGHHIEALECHVADLFVQRQFREALRYADRRARIAPRPPSRFFLLLGEILSASGSDLSAAEIFADAFADDPLDPLIIRRMLRSLDIPLRLKAAELALASPRTDDDTLHQALAVFWATGIDLVACIRSDDEELRGWIAWRNRDRALPLVRIEADRDLSSERNIVLSLVPASPHRFKTTVISAQDVAIRLRARSPIGISVTEDDGTDAKVVVSYRQLPMLLKPERSRTIKDDPVTGLPWDAKIPNSRCTVIVPVYDDIEITELCLDSVAKERLSNASLDVIVVNDRPGHADVDLLTRAFSDRHGFKLIANSRNLGFIGSINAALSSISDGDVLLLNSDVLLPAGAVERLRAAAYQRADIGLVTPLSNNGEPTSHPIPFLANVMGSIEDIERIDRVAAQVNRGLVETMPNGIGFCLYIRRDCLDAVGKLSHCYLNGYFEDVDLCLKARESGYLNVCALDVYVGHKGSSSFKASKRALVKRNLRVLQTRFPRYEDDNNAFAIADPLRRGRAAIERATVPPAHVTLLVGTIRDADLLSQRAEQWHKDGAEVLMLQLPLSRDIGGMAVRGFDGRAPQSLSFLIRTPEGVADFCDYLGRYAAFRVELLDRAVLADPFVTCLRERAISIVVLFNDSPVRPTVVVARQDCENLDKLNPCRPCLTNLAQGLEGVLARSDEQRDEGHIAEVRYDLLPLNRMALAFAECHKMAFAHDSELYLEGPASRSVLVGARGLGILYTRIDLTVERWLISLCRHLALRNPSIRIVIMGGCWDDLRLMGPGNVLVTGRLRRSDYQDVMERHEIGAILAPERWSGFGFLSDIAQQRGCPMSYFDWSLGAMAAEDSDLALSPSICNDKAIHQIELWSRRVLAQGDVDDG